jgi:ubiquinone/menaquinone biosynthesis C-methylase UbiE
MLWSPAEVEELSPILDQLRAGLEPVDGQDVLVLCSAGGEVPFRLATGMTHGHILGLELDRGLLESARLAAREKQLGHLVEFREAEKKRLPLPDRAFDALASEFIVFPTPTPTEIGQPEMARVLRPGGRMFITDVIITRPLTAAMRAELARIGLDYLCEGTPDDFRRWMGDAGLTGIEVGDLTPLVEPVWQGRFSRDPEADRRPGYALLLEGSPARLGDGLHYIYARGMKPLA